MRKSEPEPGQTEAAGSGRIRRLGAVAAVAGAAALAVTTSGALAGVEPFHGWYYHLAWYPTLLVLAGGLAWRWGVSPFSSSHRGGTALAVSLLFWSAPMWYLFELLNFRLGNWYYVWVTPELAVRWAGSFVAFATVLPALCLGYRWMEAAGLAEEWRRPTFLLRRRHLAFCFGLGVVFLTLSMWRPRAFYPLVWGALTLLLEPWNALRSPEGSLLGDLSRGRYARIVRLLAGGAVIGLLWEAYNWGAGTRWIYTVPGLEEGKLFEMPVPGYLGFPILALDGFVIYQALCNLGVAVPGWADPAQAEEASVPAGEAPMAAGERAREGPVPPEGDPPAFRPRLALAVGLGALAFSAWVQTGVDRWTVDSFAPGLPEVPAVTEAVAGELRAVGVEDVRTLARTDSTALALATGLPPEESGAVVRSARLTALRGMGAENATALWEAGVRSICDLAEKDDVWVSGAVRAARDRPRAGDLARVRVWLGAARGRCPEEERADASGEVFRSSSPEAFRWPAPGA